MKLDELIKKIESFKKLKANWDGENSIAFNEGTLKLARSIANRLPAKEDFFCCSCSWWFYNV